MASAEPFSNNIEGASWSCRPEKFYHNRVSTEFQTTDKNSERYLQNFMNPKRHESNLRKTEAQDSDTGLGSIRDRIAFCSSSL